VAVRFGAAVNRIRPRPPWALPSRGWGEQRRSLGLLARAKRVDPLPLWLSVARSSPNVRLRVQGASMFPAVRPGDVLTIERLGHSTLTLGDILVWTRAGRVIAHRVVAFDHGQPITQGDAVAAPDGAVHKVEIVGKVTRIERLGREVEVSKRVGLIARICRRYPLFRLWCLRLWRLRLELACLR
jgi:hypothetical protein